MIRHKQITKLKPKFVEKKLQEFFNEDNIFEDITTKATQQANKTVEAHFIAKEEMIFVGKEIINNLIQKNVNIEDFLTWSRKI